MHFRDLYPSHTPRGHTRTPVSVSPAGVLLPTPLTSLSSYPELGSVCPSASGGLRPFHFLRLNFSGLLGRDGVDGSRSSVTDVCAPGAFASSYLHTTEFGGSNVIKESRWGPLFMFPLSETVPTPLSLSSCTHFARVISCESFRRQCVVSTTTRAVHGR